MNADQDVIASFDRRVTAHRDEVLREWAEWIRCPSNGAAGVLLALGGRL